MVETHLRFGKVVRARIAFYASTLTYRPVFAIHDWEDVAERLSGLSKASRWDEMEALITDEMVDTIGVVAPYDRLAQALVDRYEGVCTRVEFSIPVATDEDATRLTEMLRHIQTA